MLDLVERTRTEHLARLDAEDGLQALLVDWSDVALLVGEDVARAFSPPGPPQAVGPLERPCPGDSPWDTAVSP